MVILLSPPPMATSLPTFSQRHYLSDTSSLLLLLQCRNLLAAVPPLLFAELKGLSLEFLDRECFWLLALCSKAFDEDFLPFVSRSGEEFAARFERL